MEPGVELRRTAEELEDPGTKVGIVGEVDRTDVVGPMDSGVVVGKAMGVDDGIELVAEVVDVVLALPKHCDDRR